MDIKIYENTKMITYHEDFYEIDEIINDFFSNHVGSTIKSFHITGGLQDGYLVCIIYQEKSNSSKKLGEMMDEDDNN